MGVAHYRTHQWSKYRQEWLTGKYKNLREMAKKKRISFSTLSKRSAKEDWMKRKEEVEERTEEAVIEKTVELQSNQQVEILEQQLKYAQIMIGMGFGTLAGKTKFKSEANAIRSIFAGMYAQLKTLRAMQNPGEDPDIPLPGFNPEMNITINNLNTNQVQDWSNDRIKQRLQQIEAEKKQIEGSNGK
jgi:hypothetical protein